uniref:Uncharacterized protein n=1 Tax=Steinernema glaseri TaxID=37863 RepID=A0A1I7YU21_9BILA
MQIPFPVQVNSMSVVTAFCQSSFVILIYFCLFFTRSKMSLMKKVTAIVKAVKKTSRKVKKNFRFENMDEATMNSMIASGGWIL